MRSAARFTSLSTTRSDSRRLRGKRGPLLTRPTSSRRLETLEQEVSLVRNDGHPPAAEGFQGVWADYHGGLESEAREVETSIEPDRLSAYLDRQTRLPEDFHPHPKIERAIETRRKMAEGEQPLDWSAAESLAFASLATE